MRTKLLILASSIGMLGWGTVLPYQYAYAANTRGWGALAAALASTLFSVGALVAAPFAGRLSDRFNPVTVAVVAKLLAAVGVGGLVWADVGPGLPRRHVRLRLRPDRGRPRRVGARAALGRERRPPQGLRLQVHGRGHRHGGRRLRRRASSSTSRAPTA